MNYFPVSLQCFIGNDDGAPRERSKDKIRYYYYYYTGV